MAFYRCVSKQGVKAIKLVNNCYIGTSETNVKHSPINANNYVEVIDDVAYLHRNNSSYNLAIFTPWLEAGKTYIFVFDSRVNTDNNLYFSFTTLIPENSDITVTRKATISMNNAMLKGISFTPDTAGFYGFQFWCNNISDISVNNPRLYEV